MPEKLDRCVADVKAKGGVDNPWAVCNASIGKTQEKVNQNRQVPFSNPKIKTASVEPDIHKTTKGMGGDRLNQDAFLWKSILDTKLKRDVEEPRY